MKFVNKKNIGLFIALMIVSITTVYALWTWDTWYRANNGATTTADSNGSSGNTTLLFSAIEVINNYSWGNALFVPTKTSAEWVSMWQNNPANVNLRTTREDLATHTVNTSVKRWLINNEGHCDNGWFQVTGSAWRDISNRYYNIIRVNAPEAIEWYFNFRLEYGPQVGENLRIFVPIFGQAVPSETDMHRIYRDSGSSPNPPDLDINNDGTNDVQVIQIGDPYNGSDAYRDVKVNTLVKLRAWDNYIRMEWTRASQAFACQSGGYNSSAYSMGLESGQWQVWFTNY